MIDARLQVADAAADLPTVSAAHPHARAVARAAAGDPARRDALHLFGILHGERPGAAEVAAARLTGDAARFAAAFDVERGWLARAVAAAGPTPLRLDLSTHERLVRGQRGALLALARSDRAGVAGGLVAALAADWPALRAALGGGTGAAAAAFDAPADPATARAVRFGATALDDVHRGVWDLLEAREAMRLRG